MKIDKDRVVGIEYTLKGDDGEVIDENVGSEPLHYLHGHGNIVPGLESALLGKLSGESVSVSLDPEQGYGERDEKLVFGVPRKELPDDMEPEVGLMLRLQSPSGSEMIAQIAKVTEEAITLDGNHPLAGQGLNFEVKVLEVRAASADELTHGHVHTPGHDHH